jgi:Tfp pilus assembly protein FimT
LETICVLAIMVIVAAMAYPSIEAMYGNAKLDAAADQIRARWAEARAHAIEEAQPYRFAVRPNEPKFRVAPDASQYWTGDLPNTPADSDSETPPLVAEDRLPKGINFEVGNGAEGEWAGVLTFLPDGTCKEDVEITLVLPGYKPLQLKMRALTGAVTAKYLPKESAP